jgi:hypothetical protein
MHYNFPQCPFSLGWGCDGILVATIVEELKKRMKVRGDTGNIQRIEAVQQQLKAVDRKLDLIMQHLSIEIPENFVMDRAV